MNCVASENNLLSAWMPKKKPLSFRPDSLLESRITRILEATNLTAQDLLDRCVRRSLDAVTSEVIAERRKAEDAFLREHAPPKRKAG